MLRAPRSAGRRCSRPRRARLRAARTLLSLAGDRHAGRKASAGDPMDVAQAIRLKRAVRSYAARPLPEEAIQAILLAGRRAQSAKNTQPWHFIAVQART